MSKLTLIRGLPGSGKTTLAKKLGGFVVSADDFFMQDGEYVFDPARLSEAHTWCRNQAQRALEDGLDVIVANTFTREWEVEPYRRLGVPVDILDLYDAGLTNEELAARNVHGVPVETIESMRARYEPLLIGTMAAATDRVVTIHHGYNVCWYITNTSHKERECSVHTFANDARRWAKEIANG